MSASRVSTSAQRRVSRKLSDPMTKRPFQRVAVFRALQLGDLLCAVPALRALRAALPDARLSLIGLPWAREFAAIYRGLFDDFIEFPGFPGLPERDFDAERFTRFLSEMRERKFDLVVQMHGSGRLTNSIVALFGAKFLAGTYIPGLYCPDPDRFVPHREGLHEIWRLLRLTHALGAPSQGENLHFEHRESDAEALLNIPGVAEALARPTICLHPGAREPVRCWPPESFACVGDAFAERGYSIVVTGAAFERERVAEVVRLMRNSALDLCGKTDIGAMAGLLKRSRLLICNDTGVSHLAVAVGAPSVVVFTRSEFLGWPPLDRVRHRVVARFNGAGVGEVVDEARDLLAHTEDEHLCVD